MIFSRRCFIGRIRRLDREGIELENRMIRMSSVVVGLLVTLALTAARVNAQDPGKSADPAQKPTRQDQNNQASKPACSKEKPIKYHKLETKNYTVELPEGWEAGEETSFGQREIHPPSQKAADSDVNAGASMSTMTGPGLGKQSWDQLYQTSLYFITRFGASSKKMVATPYKLGKSAQGFEACSWTSRGSKKRKSTSCAVWPFVKPSSARIPRTSRSR